MNRFGYSVLLSFCIVLPIFSYRVSIITSLYNGDEFIEGFLQYITQQTIFDECELIIINANSPGNEEPIINKYLEQYSNIVYTKLDHDPGLYAVWNMAIKMASADYVITASKSVSHQN